MPRHRRRPAPDRPLPLCAMTENERDILAAYFDSGSFKAASTRAGCDEETVSRVWHRYRRSFSPIMPFLQVLVEGKPREESDSVGIKAA